MAFTINHGSVEHRKLASFASSTATMTTLAAIPAAQRFLGLEKFVEADKSTWYFHDTSSLTAVTGLVAAPASGNGRWLRKPGRVQIKMPITFATADAAALITMPTGAVLLPLFAYWEITTGWSGGSSSAIGLSSNVTWTTKGDILGGAAGDVAATLTTALSPQPGTVGAVLAATNRVLLKATNTVRFDRITSVFTAGAGNAVLVGDLLENAGALG